MAQPAHRALRVSRAIKVPPVPGVLLAHRGLRVRPVHRVFKERQAPPAPKALLALRAHRDRRENEAMMARMDAASLFRTFIQHWLPLKRHTLPGMNTLIR